MFIIVIQKKGTKFGELQLLKNEKSERGDRNNTNKEVYNRVYI